MLKIITATLLALILGGCMVGPDYRRPAVETPQSWRFEEEPSSRPGQHRLVGAV